MARDSEQKTISKAQAGDMSAFEALVTEHEKFVYNIALRMLGSEQDAQDASQEAFIKAFQSIGSFRGDSKFSVWLYRLASNVCVDMLRKKNLPTVSLTTEDSDGEEMTLEIPDNRFCPESELEKKELREAVASAMQSLPPEFREVIVMRELSGVSYGAIASTLGLDIGTVKSRIFRARKKLCAILVSSGNFHGKNASNDSEGGVQA